MNPPPEEMKSLSPVLRQARRTAHLSAPPQTSAQAYAQMDRMSEAQTAARIPRPGNGTASSAGPKSKAS